MKISWKTFPPLVLVCLAVWAYGNALSGPFMFDDAVAVTNNPSVKQLFPFALSSRFLVDLTFRLNYALGGFNVVDYHAVNIVVHILAGLALYGIVRRTLKLDSMSARWRRHAEWVALIASSLWIVHPLQTQAVTYIAQRYESMMGLFMFLSLYCFVRASRSSRPRLWYDLCIAVCLIGMGTKQVMVATPVVILLYDWTFLDRVERGSMRGRRMVHIALFLCIAFSLLLDLRMAAASLVAGSETVASISPLTYLLTQGGVLLHYLRLSVLPWPLCLDYAWPLVSDWREAVVPVLVIGLIGCLSVWGLWRRSAVGFLGCFFFVVLAPTSSLLPLADLAFEHRMYVPLAAVTVLVAAGIHRGASRLAKLRAGRSIMAWCEGCVTLLLVLTLGVMARTRNLDYQSLETMWRATVRVRPQNYRQYLAFVSALVSNQRWAEAEQTVRRLLAATAGAQNTGGSARAVAASNAARFHAAALGQLGRILLARGRADDAVIALRKAIDEEPGQKVNYFNLGGALFMAGHVPQAIEATKRATRIDPTYAKAHSQLAFFLASIGHYRESARRYRLAVKQAPHTTYQKVELAWLLATCPDARVRSGREAVVLARDALAATQHRSVSATDALGAAFAEIGQYEDAVAFAEHALSLLIASEESGGRPRTVSRAAAWDCTAEAIQLRIASYAAGRPYRHDYVAEAE